MLECSCLFPAQEHSLDDELFERPKLKTDDNFMQNTQGKKFWRELILRYEKAIKDYDFGSLIPVDVEDEHSQYISSSYCNLIPSSLGLNDTIHEKDKKEIEAEKAAKTNCQPPCA
ncbi:hypothetical protein M422DRAFT_256729 [Sphaerobolus stellatus SS14]|uniref:Polysaccharide biosynthesis domain-containing protein n=1 Tax=Sphaerobolus stellatus (strain SS14) TaxID=990650 RepID=A0A0C9UBE2_SPHS4|nr:hypothetical protein M422DRAFT_256729 [Sphaerobolus stellatus SS14]